LEIYGKKSKPWHYSLDSSNRLNALFLAHPDCVKLGRIFNTSFVIDCTYQTNIYQLKVFSVVGITCLNTSFYFCIAFLPRKIEEWFEWALTKMINLFCDVNIPKTFSIDRDLALYNVMTFRKTSW